MSEVLANLDRAFLLFVTLGLSVARVTACLLLIPVFSLKLLSRSVRGALCLSIGLLMLPFTAAAPLPPDWTVVVALAAKEVVIGALLGFVLAQPFWLLDSVGDLFDSQRGAMSGQQLNPALDMDTGVTGEILMRAMLVLLVELGGMTALVELMWHSYRIWPATAWLPLTDVGGWSAYLALFGDTLHAMLRFAGPLVLVMLLVECAFALLSVHSPKLQAYFLAMPAKTLAGLLVAVIYLPYLWDLAGDFLLHRLVLPPLPIRTPPAP